MAEMTWRTEDLMLAPRITESHRDFQQIIVSASRDGFSATRNSWLDSGDIEQFGLSYRNERGSAFPKPPGNHRLLPLAGRLVRA